MFSQRDKERLRSQFMAKAERIFEQALAQGNKAELNLSQIEGVVGELKFELTSLLDLTGRSREEMVFDKEKLLSVYDQTKDAEPMPSARLGGTVEGRG